MYTPETMHLYQLCRLGVSGTLLASVLFDELKITIPCKAMTLLWLPLGSSDARVFHESDAEISCGVLDAESFNQIFFTSTIELFTVLKPEHPVLRKIVSVFPDIRPVIEQNENTLAIYFTGRGQRTGAIFLHRSPGELFSTEEKMMLSRWAATLYLALNADIETSQFITSENNSGILLLDSIMKVQYACCRGRKLIKLSQASDNRRRHENRNGELDIKLHANFRSGEGVRASSFVLRNIWGGVQFRLHQMSDSKIHQNQLTAVTVQRQEPLTLGVFRGCRKLSLTEKQTEISLLLVNGLSYDAVATQLCISSNTVVDHVRKIYEKVGVANRSELVTTLLLGTRKEVNIKPSHDAGVVRNPLHPSIHYGSPAHIAADKKEVVRGYAL